MKAKIFTSVCALFLIIGVFGQRAVITLTFTAIYNESYIPLDSIRVVNQTQGVYTVLHGINTLTLTDPTGINELNSSAERLQIFQNYPNPVIDQTRITMFVPEKDKVGIIITDILGRMMLNREMILERGYHTFRYFPGESEICFFSAFWQGSSSSIKILSSGTGSGRKSNLEYTGNTMEEPPSRSLKSIQDLPWTEGDLLVYTGYASIDNTIIASAILEDAPVTDTTYTFAILKGLRCSGDPMVTDIDGNVYLTLKIGDQCWMAENLKTTKYNDGADISLVTDNDEWLNLMTPAYCWYHNNIYYKDIYGAIYNWFTVETSMLCPTGWHVPTDSEWTTLTDYLGGVGIAGGKLKEQGTAHWNTNTGATNEFGFTSLPGGSRNALMGNFDYMGEYTYMWSMTLDLSGNSWAWYRSNYHNTNTVGVFAAPKANGYSVRCIKNIW